VPQDEAYAYTNVSFARHELWPIQEDGDLCELIKIGCFNVVFNHVQRAKPATKREMTQFHSDDYVDFLSRITPLNMNSFIKEQHKCKLAVCTPSISTKICIDNVGDDCPVFDGLFEYCSISAGGSMGKMCTHHPTNQMSNSYQRARLV
jgi:hypothetical protein